MVSVVFEFKKEIFFKCFCILYHYFKAIGWTVSCLGVVQLPIWAIYAVLKQKGITCNEKLKNSFKPQSNWGPKNAQLFESYQKYISSYEELQRLQPSANFIIRFKRHIFGFK